MHFYHFSQLLKFRNMNLDYLIHPVFKIHDLWVMRADFVRFIGVPICIWLRPKRVSWTLIQLEPLPLLMAFGLVVIARLIWLPVQLLWESWFMTLLGSVACSSRLVSSSSWLKLALALREPCYLISSYNISTPYIFSDCEELVL